MRISDPVILFTGKRGVLAEGEKMITVYQVINQADNCPCGPGRSGYHYERQDEAESFRAKLASLTGEPTERYAVTAVALDTLPARRVVVRGMRDTDE